MFETGSHHKALADLELTIVAHAGLKLIEIYLLCLLIARINGMILHLDKRVLYYSLGQ